MDDQACVTHSPMSDQIEGDQRNSLAESQVIYPPFVLGRVCVSQGAAVVRTRMASQPGVIIGVQIHM
jgi:hypothetical protein